MSTATATIGNGAIDDNQPQRATGTDRGGRHRQPHRRQMRGHT
jgi:hypothetical protein